jgi:hypothetical protein
MDDAEGAEKPSAPNDEMHMAAVRPQDIQLMPEAPRSRLQA